MKRLFLILSLISPAAALATEMPPYDSGIVFAQLQCIICAIQEDPELLRSRMNDYLAHEFYSCLARSKEESSQKKEQECSALLGATQERALNWFAEEIRKANNS